MSDEFIDLSGTILMLCIMLLLVFAAVGEALTILIQDNGGLYYDALVILTHPLAFIVLIPIAVITFLMWVLNAIN